MKLQYIYKFDNYKSYKKPGTIDDEAINKATVHHVTNNAHHPEHWTDQKEALINKEDRDKPPKEIVDATKMPDIHIAEMVADWSAMSEELAKNTPKEWADDNVNVRWKFTDHQKDLIYELISVAWKDKKESSLKEAYWDPYLSVTLEYGTEPMGESTNRFNYPYGLRNLRKKENEPDTLSSILESLEDEKEENKV